MNQAQSGGSGRRRVLMYATGYCPYCMRAEAFLRKKGFATIDKIRVDLDPARRNEMMLLTGQRTVPQIFVGDTYVGGCDELYALDRVCRLDPMLADTVA